MFTNFKRIMVFVVLAFACMLLVACGEKEPAKPVLKAPTEITILVEDAPLEKATSVDGDDIVLAIEEQEGVDTSVTWESMNTKVATVDENGFVTPVSAGQVKIVATSVKNPDVQAEITLRVHPADIGALLAEAGSYIKENVKFIELSSRKFQLPCSFRSDLLKYEYRSLSTGTVDSKCVYKNDTWYQGDKIDTVEKLECKVTYIPTGASALVTIEVYIVSDAENNDFTKIAATKEKIRALFANENLDAYDVAEKLLQIDKPADVAVIWTSDVAEVLKPVYVAGEATDSKTDDEFKLVYTRPLDWTQVELTATVMAGSQGETEKFNIKAVGYTKTEKVEYFKDVVCANLPTADDQLRKDIRLPLADTLFGLRITWTSDHPELLSAEGVYTDDVTKDSTQGTKVTLTASVKYVSPNDYIGQVNENTGEIYTSYTDPNSFDEEVKFEIMVYPCTENTRSANKVVAYAKEHVAEGTGWFPWGKIDRASNQLTGLPATMGEAGVTGDYANVALNWTCSETGLFDAEWNLLKQYLRYHQVMLTATVQLGESTEVIEVPLNVGIAQKEMTSHIGGSFSRLAVQKSDNIFNAMDSLQTISAFDGMVGSQQTWYKGDQKGQYYEIRMGASEDLTKNLIVQPTAEEDSAYATKPVTASMQFGIGVNCGFGGVTLYWDDPDSGIRFQFFTVEAMTWVIGPDDVDENGDLIDKDGDGMILSMLDRYQQNWDHLVFVNMSGKDIRIPISYSKDYDTLTTQTRQVTYVPYDQKMFGERSKFGTEGLGAISLSLYSGDYAGLVQPNGKVGCVEAEAKWEDSLADLSSGLTGDDGVTEYCQYLTLQNGGVAWTAGEAQDDGYTDSKGASVHHTTKEYVGTMFSTAGNEVTIEFWNIHPCNTFTTNDEWQLPEGYTAELGGVRKRTSTLTNVYFWARTLDATKYNVNAAWVAAAQAEEAQ